MSGVDGCLEVILQHLGGVNVWARTESLQNAGSSFSLSKASVVMIYFDALTHCRAASPNLY